MMELEHQLENSLELIQNNAEALQMLLSSYSGTVLHHNHYLMVAAKRYLLYQLPVQDIQRVELARQILRIFDVITPGLTKERGLCLFEIHAGLLRRLKKVLQTTELTSGEAKKMLKELNHITLLGLEACQCLKFERPDTFEGKINFFLRAIQLISSSGAISTTLNSTLSTAGHLKDALNLALEGCVTQT